MTTLQHPHIDPPLLIEVEDDRVPDYLEAGWLPADPESFTPDPDPTGEDHEPHRGDHA